MKNDYPIKRLPDTRADKAKIKNDIQAWLDAGNKPTVIKTGVSGNEQPKGFNNRRNEVNRRRSSEAAKRRNGRL
ncbi:MAG: hypothetical protein KDA17_07875 [Candidatus Saccharibacteria bacterium]|nr:hypothetical protein [Candidatus Saccharibacteria bacterium]